MPTYGKNGECLIDIACRLKQIGRGTAGLCLNGGGALIFNLGGEVCVQADKNGIFFSATGATPGDNHLPADYSDSSFGLGGTVPRTVFLARFAGFLFGGMGTVSNDRRDRESTEEERWPWPRAVA